MFSFNRKKIIYLVVGLLIVNLILLFYFLDDGKKIIENPENLKIIFIDVGQGDAALIRTTQGQNILIDGGPDKGIIYKLDQYIPFNRRVIDLMILTHPDPDHLNGLIEVIKRYQVRRFIFNGVDDDSPNYYQFLKKIEEKKITLEVVWQGKKIDFFGGYLEFLYPLESLANKRFKNDNEASLVFKLIVGRARVLFMGDANKKVEAELLKKNFDLKSDILKVGHHGSNDSTGYDFLAKVRPVYAVISVSSNNKYGHPNLRVLKNLEMVDSQILQTSQQGDIIFEIDGLALIKN